MINVTLDTNCITDLEECRGAAPDIRALISMHEEQKINLRVGAFSASEGKLGGKPDSDFAELQQKIAKVGLGHIEVMKPPIGRLGMIFLDWFLLGDKQIEDVE